MIIRSGERSGFIIKESSFYNVTHIITALTVKLKSASWKPTGRRRIINPTPSQSSIYSLLWLTNHRMIQTFDSLKKSTGKRATYLHLHYSWLISQLQCRHLFFMKKVVHALAVRSAFNAAVNLLDCENHRWYHHSWFDR